MTLATETSSTRHSRSRKSRDTAVSSSYDGTMIDDDESDFYSHSMDSSTESSASMMIDVVSDSSNSKTGKMANRDDRHIGRHESKVTMASSIISASYDESNSSDNTDEVFARARALKVDASKSRSGSRVTFVGEVTGNKSGNGSTDGDGDDEESEEEEGRMERGYYKSDPTTFLVDAEDTFQVFDGDCNFAPSRGTLCVLCLCIVVAAQGVAIGLYFALR